MFRSIVFWRFGTCSDDMSVADNRTFQNIRTVPRNLDDHTNCDFLANPDLGKYLDFRTANTSLDNTGF